MDFPELEFPELHRADFGSATPTASPAERDARTETPAPATSSLDATQTPPPPADPPPPAPDPADAAASSLEPALAGLERSVPGWNRHDITACARASLVQIEAAVSLAEPERCRTRVEESVYQALRATIAEAARRGQRRVHGDFDILEASLCRVDGPEQVGVIVKAVSTVVEMDARGGVVGGSPDLVRWAVELTMRHAADRPLGEQWVVSAVGPEVVEGPVVGAAGPPLRLEETGAPEARIQAEEREADAEHAALMNVAAIEQTPWISPGIFRRPGRGS